MASVFKDTVAQAVANQPWYIRRKDTITAVAGTILQMANVFAAYTAGMPEYVNILVAVVIGVAQIAVHAGTKGAITPSMAGRLETAGLQSHLDRPSVSDYVGEHRAQAE